MLKGDGYTESSGQQGTEGGAARKRGVRLPSYMRICFTPSGPVRLTPTEMQILSFVQRHEGRAYSKAQIAAALGRNEKTISRLISRLRQYQILETEPSYAENGAQLANVYRIVKASVARKDDPAPQTHEGATE